MDKTYEEKAVCELIAWQRMMLKKPSLTNRLTKRLQSKVSSIIPDKVHKMLTETVKNMIKAVLFGSEFITRKPLINVSLEERETLVKERLDFYKKAGMVSGAGTGAGGILVGLADFPILISLKLKFLFDTASLYGFDVRNYQERLYILHIFQLAFSSQQRANQVYHSMLDWNSRLKELPLSLNDFDWHTFQQEYRDYIDLVKMLQLVPGIGAAVGAYANYQLMERLGKIAVNAYRLRLFASAKNFL